MEKEILESPDRSQAFRVFCSVTPASIAAITSAAGRESSIRRWLASQVSVAFLCAPDMASGRGG
jgi:hypothetical protein